MAVVEVGPLPTTDRPRLATSRDIPTRWLTEMSAVPTICRMAVLSTEREMILGGDGLAISILVARDR